MEVSTLTRVSLEVRGIGVPSRTHANMGKTPRGKGLGHPAEKGDWRRTGFGGEGRENLRHMGKEGVRCAYIGLRV